MEQWRTDWAKIAEKRQFYICIAYVLKTCNRRVLRNWWSIEVTSRLLAFFTLLFDIVEVFQYDPEYKEPSISKVHSSAVNLSSFDLLCCLGLNMLLRERERERERKKGRGW